MDSCVIAIGPPIPTLCSFKFSLSSSPSLTPISFLHHFRSSNANESYSFRIKQLKYRQRRQVWAETKAKLECIDSSTSVINDAEWGEYSPTLEGLGFLRNEVKLFLELNPEQSLASISRSLQALQALGMTGSRLIDLVKKHPFVFRVNIERIVRVIKEKEVQGFDMLKIHKVLLSDPSLLSDFPEKVELLLHHGLPLPHLKNVLNRISLRKFCQKSIEELDGVVTFLKQFDLEKESCFLIIRCPSLLHLSLQRDLMPKTAIFEKLDGDPRLLKMTFRRLPAILTFGVERLEALMVYFKSMGFTEKNVFMMIEAEPRILSSSLERKLNPRIEFLMHCGLSQEEVAKYIIRYPSFLIWAFADNISKKLTFLLKIGFPSYSSELAKALCAITRSEYDKLQTTIDLLVSYGLSYDDIRYMSKKNPDILRYNPELMKAKIDYLVNDMNRSKADLLAFPTYLGYSLADRIKPRHETIKWMISRGLAKENFSLNTLLSTSNAEFFNMEIQMGFVTEQLVAVDSSSEFAPC